MKVAKLRLEAASNKTQVVARAGLPTATHLTMDDDDKDVNVATTIKRGLPMATALGNDRIIGGPAPASMISSARKMAPGRAAKLRIGAESDKTRVVARAGMPAAMHLTMDNTTRTLMLPRPSNVALPWRQRSATTASSAVRRPPARLRPPGRRRL